MRIVATVSERSWFVSMRPVRSTHVRRSRIISQVDKEHMASVVDSNVWRPLQNHGAKTFYLEWSGIAWNWCHSSLSRTSTTPCNCQAAPAHWWKSLIQIDIPVPELTVTVSTFRVLSYPWLWIGLFILSMPWTLSTRSRYPKSVIWLTCSTISKVV